MKQSNIFTYVELSKMIDNLSTTGSSAKIKEKSKSQAAYFNIIDPKYFSEQLSKEWIDIVAFVKKRCSQINSDGKIVVNSVLHTIDCLSDDACNIFAKRLFTLHDKLKREFV